LKVLCLDIGNTRAKYALYEGRNCLRTGFYPKFLVRDIRKLCRENAVAAGIISSTRHKNTSVIKYLKKELDTFIELDHKTKIPVTNAYATPKTLGMDRLAAAVGAYTKNPGKAHLVIDAGSCMTLDIIDKEGCFQGGNITPGMYMRVKAMNDHTDKLPLVPLAYHEELLGRSTKMALQNGAVRGTLFEIEAFIQSARKEYPRININLTGGDTEFLAKYLKSKILADPNLVFVGLNEIVQHNV
jgi:type III pantothenate kinase